MSDSKKILLIGGTGFVGKKIAAQLVTNGYEVIVPTRFSAHAKELSVLPRLKLVPADVHNPQALAQLMAGLSQGDAVINLVGILHDRPGVPYGKNFAKNHVELHARVHQRLHHLGVVAARDARHVRRPRDTPGGRRETRHAAAGRRAHHRSDDGLGRSHRCQASG